MNLGFSDVKVLGELIGPLDKAWNWKALRRYERQRKSETFIATQAFSGLKSIYGINSRPFNALRDIGMRLVQSSPVCRRMLLQKAMNNMS